MASSSATQPRNRLLAALSPADLTLLQPQLTPVPLKLRQELEKPNRRIDDVYLPTSASLPSSLQTHAKRVEIGLIGCEGMTGTAAVLGGQSSPHSTYIQAPGDNQHISAGALCKAMVTSKTLHGMLLKFVQVFMVQTAHTGIANPQAKLRWFG